MKRLTPAQSVRILRIAHRRWLIRLRRRRRRHIKPVAYQDYRIEPPSLLSFSNNFGATMAFFEEFRDAMLATDRMRRVFVDLAPIQTISVPAAIMLAAEFHRWSIIRGVSLKPRNASSWAPRVRGLLADLGVFKLLGIRGLKREYGPETLTLSRLRSGERLDGKAINGLQSDFARVVQGFTNRPGVYDGLTEAAENAIAHAYPADFEPKHPFAGHRWWGVSCLDMTDMRLRLFIFDHGAGIPYTVPRVSWFEEIRNLISQLGLISDDAQMLRAAFQVGRTRTGQANRGLGLQRMADVVRGINSAYLRVLSGQGEMVYRHDDRIETNLLATGVGGTLIEWNMPADLFLEVSEG